MATGLKKWPKRLKQTKGNRLKNGKRFFFNAATMSTFLHWQQNLHPLQKLHSMVAKSMYARSSMVSFWDLLFVSLPVCVAPLLPKVAALGSSSFSVVDVSNINQGQNGGVSAADFNLLLKGKDKNIYQVVFPHLTLEKGRQKFLRENRCWRQDTGK